jgi:glutathione S-transferase
MCAQTPVPLAHQPAPSPPYTQRATLRRSADDGNQFCRLVREVLTELDLPYELVSVAKGSPRRATLAELAGRSTAPYLVDANSGEAMFESADIVAYLHRQYAS